MKAIQVPKTGGAEVLTLADVPMPQAKPNEAIVKIAAVGVNFADVYMREGRYPAELPFIVGQEAAGTVVEVGSEVKSFRAGDRVVYAGVHGTYAEYQAAPAGKLVRIPEGVSEQQAAAVFLQGLTAQYLVKSTYPLREGELALVHAAAGGVGLLLVQMAKEIGARVIATVGSDAKAELVKQYGVPDVIVYTKQDFEAETKRIVALQGGGQGVHVVYDGVGKSTFDKGLNVLRPRGYMVLYGGASGAVPPVDPILLMRKGSLFLTRPTLGDYIASRAELEERAGDLLGSLAEHRLRLRVEHVYPLKDAAQAHRDLESRKTTGKLLLVP